jgi:hypothetical protein
MNMGDAQRSGALSTTREPEAKISQEVNLAARTLDGDAFCFCPAVLLSSVCDISAEAFVAGPQQPEVERTGGFFAGVIAAHKAAGFVPKRSLGEMYAAKNCNGTDQKLLPVVGRIGYARH